MSDKFLPVTLQEAIGRGWDRLDIIIVTGDAYVDHPSYGAAIIGRALEAEGYKIGIIAQPDWRSVSDFKKLGKPGLFFGITAGNLDSMLANYTSNRNRRREDEYSPGGRVGLRPDRATIIYANRVREAFGAVPIVIGGVEASLRRLAHYDYWSDKVRRSILLDSKADILVYGMGEPQIVEIAGRLKAGESVKDFSGIKGTVAARSSLDGMAGYVKIPSFADVSGDKDKFNEAFRIIYDQQDPIRGKALVQAHGDRFVIQNPPAMPLSTRELDRIYELPFKRGWHPMYDNTGGIPGFETVRYSIVSHRGCSGACNFCSLYLHQGRIVQSRSADSILREAREISQRPDFRGTITDLGGPTANMYLASCKEWQKSGACRSRNCLTPSRCKNFIIDYEKNIKLWNDILKLPKVKHLFIGSGLRYDLLAEDDSGRYLEELCRSHIGGRIKVAAEHSDEKILKLMNKPSFKNYYRFVKKFEAVNKALGKKQFIVNYLISAHPGSTLEDALNLSLALAKKKIHPEQIQDYIPLPMTISGSIYYTGMDTFTGKPVYVARGLRERKLQRTLIQHDNPENRKYVIEALKKLGRMDLSPIFLGRRGKDETR